METETKLVWVPLFPADFSIETSMLPLNERGAYFSLILHYAWSQNPLPDDDVFLCRITGANPKEWQKMRPGLEPLFQVADGKWRHLRLDKHIEQARLLRSKRVAAGRKGADVRWLREARREAGDE